MYKRQIVFCTQSRSNHNIYPCTQLISLSQAGNRYQAAITVKYVTVHTPIHSRHSNLDTHTFSAIWVICSQKNSISDKYILIPVYDGRYPVTWVYYNSFYTWDILLGITQNSRTVGTEKKVKVDALRWIFQSKFCFVIFPHWAVPLSKKSYRIMSDVEEVQEVQEVPVEQPTESITIEDALKVCLLYTSRCV